MDFDLSDDQRLLKDSVDRLVSDLYEFEKRKKLLAEPDGWSREMWARFAELGLLGLPFSEAQGGFGGGPVETMIVMEAFGRGLATEPYLATVVLGGGLITYGADEAVQNEILPQVAGGELLLAFAHEERQSRFELFNVATRAERDGEGWKITGHKGVVLHGDVAGKLLVTARTGGGQRERAGVGLFLVDASDAGVSRRGYPTQDALRAAEVEFDGAHAVALGDPGGGLPTVERVVDRAIAALCAEAVGVMGELHALTVDYMKQRKQFGVPISSFQVLQHRSVDMFVSLEQARSMAMFATTMADEEDARERARAIAAAKVQIGKSGRHVGQEAVQLHGGIGMTMEYKVGHYFKRITMIDTMFGGVDFHLDRLGSMGGLFAAAA